MSALALALTHTFGHRGVQMMAHSETSDTHSECDALKTLQLAAAAALHSLVVGYSNAVIAFKRTINIRNSPKTPTSVSGTELLPQLCRTLHHHRLRASARAVCIKLSLVYPKKMPRLFVAVPSKSFAYTLFNIFSIKTHSIIAKCGASCRPYVCVFCFVSECVFWVLCL